ncbi:hypothetical protein FJZ31_29345 [Candidatus Poribacteria bacterium]|nr:hypothetical protein [Candidatus Poribacteria bacterium]
MSEVMLNIIDANRAIHGEIHGSIADRVVAALSAEPETIEELEAAVARFDKPTGEYGLFDFFSEGICEEAWDAGIVIVDLAARVVASESTYSSFQKRGRVQYHDGSAATDVWVNYQAPDDWLFINYIDGWQALAQRRRAERTSTPPLDARKVIYGKVTEFIVNECLSAAASGAEEPIADIHARWLMTPRSDLRCQTPRDVLLAKLEFIDLDLQWRGYQWAFVGECPPGLSNESAAYRFGGFGTHENVLYYDLVRYLLEACWHRVSDEKNIEVESEIERLERLKEDWLHTPQNDLHDMSPVDVIKQERMRIPVTISAEQMMLDDDFELYQMLQEDGNPTFWHLDGSHMDYDFPFSFYHTREEWEEEQRSWETSYREWEERRAGLTPGPSHPDSSLVQREREGEDEIELLPSVWQRSYVNWDELEALPPESAIEIMLLGMGMHLEELGLDLEGSQRGRELAESLRRDFADLRHALRSDTRELVEAHLHRMHECLEAIAVAMPHLVDKCIDFHSQLDQLGNLFVASLPD